MKIWICYRYKKKYFLKFLLAVVIEQWVGQHCSLYHENNPICIGVWCSLWELSYLQRSNFLHTHDWIIYTCFVNIPSEFLENLKKIFPWNNIYSLWAVVCRINFNINCLFFISWAAAPFFPKYFGSKWSCTKIDIPHCPSICAFGSQSLNPNTVLGKFFCLNHFVY